MKKKIISTFLAMVMLISVIVVPAYAAGSLTQTEILSRMERLQEERVKIERDNKIVWLDGAISQYGSPFIVKIKDASTTVGIVKNTNLLYWIDDTEAEKINWVNSYSNYVCYLGESNLYDDNGVTVKVNHMGPVPARYLEVLEEIGTLSSQIEVDGFVDSGAYIDETSSNEFLPVYHNGYIIEEGMFVNGLQQGWFARYDKNGNMNEPSYYTDGIQVWSSIDNARYLFETNDASTNIIFMQIGNPFFFSYGNWSYHEKGNINATPVGTPEGRTLIPIRSFIESVGGIVEWNSSTNQITVQLNPSNKVVFTIGSNIAVVNGVSKTMDVKAQIVNGKTMIPLRFACESVGITNITWDAATKSIVIRYPQLETFNNGILNHPDALG